MTGFLRRHAGTSLAFALSLAAVALQHHRQFDPHVRYDRFQLPGFDAYAYVAMAEHPQFFTVAPWGYRVLTPWLVAALPGVGPARGFYYVTWAALIGAGVLLFLWLRRLGVSPAPALLGVVAYGFSPPLLDVLRYPFVADPLCLLLLLAFLWLLEAGAGLAILSLVAVSGALTKEILLLPLPLLLVAARAPVRSPRTWLRVALAALPSIVVTLELRRWWQPHLAADGQAGEWQSAARAIGLIAAAWQAWLPLILLGGLLPLALLGATRRCARPFLWRYGYLILALLALPFAASVYVGPADRPSMFFSGDIARLTLHIVPFLIALALIGLDRLWPHIALPPAARPIAVAWRRAAALLAVSVTLLPLFFLDRYRRIDLASVRDGLVVLATVRETLRTAGRLERGAVLTFSSSDYRFVPRKFEAPLMGRMRWFLREGWGFQAYYDVKLMTMRAAEARILLPCLEPRATRLVLRMQASPPERVLAEVNGQLLTVMRVGMAEHDFTLDVPAAPLFRGDNLITLRRGGDSPVGPRLLAVTVGP